MANNKTKAWWPAFCHAIVYSLPFLLIGSARAFLVIFVTHLLIDRFRLARYVVWLKNRVTDRAFPPVADCPTGYAPSVPVWLSTWLLIITDNTMHVCINYAALRWL
jgi:hypothetical protein